MLPDIEKIKTIQYFSGICPDEIDLIARSILVKEVNQGEIFVHEGKNTTLVYFVISGLVRVYTTSAEGKEQVLHLASTGETLNDVSAFDGKPDLASMSAMTPSVLYCIRTDDLRIILLSHPQIALNALKVIAKRVRRASRLVEDLSFSQAIGRLAKILLRYSEEGLEEHLRLTQQDLASMIGTSREMVNKSLKIIEEKGAIKLSRPAIQITDIDTLKEIALTAPAKSNEPDSTGQPL